VAALILACAPPGYGKTTLLAQWASRVEAPDRLLAWFTVDPGDDSVFRFWSGVLAALERAGGSRTEPFRRLSPPQVAGDVDFLADLVEGLAATAAVLVLDDLHEITEPEVLHDLNRLVRQQPPGTTLVLASRLDPPLLELPRARLAGRVHELRAEALAFERADVDTLCAELSAEQVDRVWEATEGWPALVRLVGMALAAEGEDGVGQVPTDRNLADYLFQEAFARHEDRVQQALLSTSVPDAVTIELAAELSGDPYIGHLLDSVAEQSGLVSRLPDGNGDIRWSYHPMLRAYLRGELRRRDLAAEHKAQRTAARWCVAAGLDAEAVRHAVAAADPGLLDEVLRETGPALLVSGEASLLLQLLRRADVPTLRRTPWSSALRAAALLDLGQVHEAFVEHVRDPPVHAHAGASPDADLAALRVATWLELRRRAVPELPPTLPDDRPALEHRLHSPDVRLLLLARRGASELWSGERVAAERSLRGAVELARARGRSGALVDALSALAALHASRADFTAATEDAEAALRIGEHHGWTASSRMAAAHLLLGWGAYQALDDHTARAHVAEVLVLLATTADPGVELSATALNALLAGDGRASAADDLFEALAGHSAPQAAAGVFAQCALAGVRLSLAGHRHRWAQEITDGMRARLGACAELALAEAMSETAAGRSESARARVRSVTSGSVHAWVPTTVLEAHLLGSVQALRAAEDYAAVEHLRAALDIADESRMWRPLVDSEAAVHDVLVGNQGRWGAHEELVATVLAHAGREPTSAVMLTLREVELLAELPSLNTVEDIAAALHVSRNTVKTHLRGIYRKLGVSSRREAVAAARRAGLL